MTILTKKKGGNSSKSGGNGEADSGDHGGGAHVLPHPLVLPQIQVGQKFSL